MAVPFRRGKGGGRRGGGGRGVEGGGEDNIRDGGSGVTGLTAPSWPDACQLNKYHPTMPQSPGREF